MGEQKKAKTDLLLEMLHLNGKLELLTDLSEFVKSNESITRVDLMVHLMKIAIEIKEKNNSLKKEMEEFEGVKN